MCIQRPKQPQTAEKLLGLWQSHSFCRLSYFGSTSSTHDIWTRLHAINSGNHLNLIAQLHVSHIRIKVFAIVRSFIKINLHSVWASFGLSYGGCKIPQKVTIIKFASCVDLSLAWVNSARFRTCFKCYNTSILFYFSGCFNWSLLQCWSFCKVGECLSTISQQPCFGKYRLGG